MRRRTWIVLAALLAVAYTAGYLVRSELDIGLTPESIRDTVAAMGWKAPAIFLGLLTFRQFLMLPAIVLLPVGGICFGAWAGAALGTSGIVLSALMTFGMARVVGTQWLQNLFAERTAWIGQAIERAGPLIIGGVTAHPTGPMSAAFWAAGFSSMALLPFLAAVAAGGAVRALAYSFFGATLPEAGSLEFWVAGAVLLAVGLVPFAHPRLRARIVGTLRAPAGNAAADADVAPDAADSRSRL
jgi:uncharacterized membrane protein YdjX (TVP38/TMEM64 family)